MKQDKVKYIKESDITIPREQLSQTVIEISKINFETYTMVPHSWFLHIQQTTKGGEKKANPIAILLLGDICYWYKATPIHHPSRLEVIGYQRKFKYDKLKLRYSDMASRYGQSNSIIQKAMLLLSNLRLVNTELRNIITRDGDKLINALFVEPVPEMIAAITYSTLEKKVSPTGVTLTPTGVTPAPVGVTKTKSTTKSIITPDLRSDSFPTPPSGDSPSGLKTKPQLKLYKTPKQTLFKYYRPQADTDRKYLEIADENDKAIINKLPDLLRNYSKADDFQTALEEALYSKKLPEGIFKKIDALRKIIKKAEIHVLKDAIKKAQSRGKENSLSYLWGIIKKNQGIQEESQEESKEAKVGITPKIAK